MKKILQISIITLTLSFGLAETKLFAQTTYYWVGQPTPGTETKWSEPINWVVPNPNVVTAILNPLVTPLNPPTILDDVIFNAASFDPTVNPNSEVVIDADAFCKTMDWTGSGLYSPIFSGDKDLTIAGSLTFVPEMSVPFKGKVNFQGTGVITSAGKTFLEEVTFSVGTWQLADEFSASDKVNIISGILEDKGFQITGVSGKTFTMSSGAKLNLTRSGDAFPANFSIDLASTSIVEYSSSNAQIVKGFSGGGSSSYGILNISGNSTKTLSAASTVRTSLTINAGILADGGFQLNASTPAASSLTIKAGATLNLGSATAATAFPGFTTNTFEDGSTVHYSASVFQTVKGFSAVSTGSYSNLILSGGGTKHLGAATTIRGNLIIETNTILSDQIFTLTGNSTGTMTMASGARISLFASSGLTAPNSPMPLFNIYNLDINSTVNYASNGAQGIRAIAGSGNNSYANLTLANSLTGASTVTKTLAGNILVRGNLNIGTRNILDVSTSIYAIAIQGNWVNSGTFTPRTGTVTFSGGNSQTITMLTPTSTSNFFNKLVINKSSNSTIVTLLSPVSIGQVNTNKDYMGANGELQLIVGDMITTSTNTLIFNNNSIVSGASHNSHVVGPVQKVGNDEFTYPIGDGTTYRPSGIDAPANVFTGLTMQYYAGNASTTYDSDKTNRYRDINRVDANPSGTDLAGLNGAVNKYEYWTLINNGAGSANAKVNLTWQTGTAAYPLSGPAGYLGNPYSLVVATWSSTNWTDGTKGQWINRGGANVRGTNTVSADGQSGTIDGTEAVADVLNYFTIGTVGFNALPVELISFKAKAVNGQVVLDWQSGKETNVSHYVVERSSADMNNFQAVKEMRAKGESTALVSYTATDANPVSGISYYRLKMVDNDGTFEYSKIVAIQMTSAYASPAAVTLYPNPSDGRSINLSVSNNDAPLSLQLFDMMGKPLSHVITESNNGLIAVQFNETLPTGMYVAVLTNTANQQKTQLRYIVK